MLPYLDLGFVKISLYEPLFFAGFLLAFFLVLKVSGSIGLSRRNTVMAGIYGLVGILIGAKLVYFFVKLPEVLNDVSDFNTWIKNDTFGALEFLFGGMVYYGGLIGFCMGICLFSKRFLFNRLNILDLFAPFIPLAHAFGRLGCFCEGCCYGVKYNGFLSVTYPENPLHPEVSYVARFPVQLLEAGLNLLCFILLYKLLQKEMKTPVKERRFKQGQLIGIYFAYYTVARFLLELLRGDDVRGSIGIFSTSQFISILMVPITAYLLRARMSKPVFFVAHPEEEKFFEEK